MKTINILANFFLVHIYMQATYVHSLKCWEKSCVYSTWRILLVNHLVRFWREKYRKKKCNSVKYINCISFVSSAFPILTVYEFWQLSMILSSNLLVKTMPRYCSVINSLSICGTSYLVFNRKINPTWLKYYFLKNLCAFRLVNKHLCYWKLYVWENS